MVFSVVAVDPGRAVIAAVLALVVGVCIVLFRHVSRNIGQKKGRKE